MIKITLHRGGYPTLISANVAAILRAGARGHIRPVDYKTILESRFERLGRGPGYSHGFLFREIDGSIELEEIFDSQIGAFVLRRKYRQNPKFRVGDIVVMSGDALENYGYEWEGRELEITHVATKYMPAKEFYAQGRPEGYHPGYDEGSGRALYDLKEVETGKDLAMSLYDWELEEPY